MKRWISGLALVLASWHATAQMYIEPGLTEDENKILQFSGHTSTAYAYWIKSTTGFERIKEHIRRYALVMRCEKLSPRGNLDRYHFDAQIRTATYNQSDLLDSGKILPTSKEIYRWRHRPLFWALSELATDQKRDFFNFIDSPDGKRAIALKLTLQVLSYYPESITDINSGMQMGASILILKEYFVKAGQLDIFYRMVEKVLPDLLLQIKELPSLEEADYGQINKYLKLTDGAFQASYKLEQAFYEVLSVSDLKNLDMLLNSQFNVLFNDAMQAIQSERSAALQVAINAIKSPADTPNTSGIALQKSDDEKRKAANLEKINASMNAKFPSTRVFSEALWKAGPKEYAGNTYQQFCAPPPPNNTPPPQANWGRVQ